MLYEIEVQVIHPGIKGDASDETWFARSTVRTFKASGNTYDDITGLADAALAAYLEAHPGTLGTWTVRSWIRR